MRVAELQKELKKRKLSTEGLRAELFARLEKIINEEDNSLRGKLISDPEEAEMILENGTKLTKIITFLKEVIVKPENRVIVFSSFNELLEKISKALTGRSVAHVIVKGNVHQRNNAIGSFKSSDSKVQVILLSLDNAASGTNLMEATHVILVDPAAGTKEEAEAIEDQAIGRAYRQGQKNSVTVVRFIMRNTIEHQLYLRRKTEEQEENVVSVDTGNNKPKMMRTNSLCTLLANSPEKMKRSGSILDLMENENLT